MSIAVIILNYCSYNDVVECINSIKMNNIIDLKCYVIDNNSIDRSGYKLAEYYKNDSSVEVYLNKTNNGYNAGNNIGIKMALNDKKEYIIISNPDILFKQTAIKNLISTFSSNIGIVGPKIFNLDGSIYSFAQRKKITDIKELYLLKFPFSYFNFNKVKDKMFYKSSMLSNQLEVFSVSGCCFAISAKVARLLYPFDENLFMYMEETSIGKKISESGYKEIYTPKSEVIHNHKIERKMLSSKAIIYKCSSELYYIINILDKSFIYTIPILFYYYLIYAVGVFYKRDYRKNIELLFKETKRSYQIAYKKRKLNS